MLLHKSSLELCVFFLSINDPGKSVFFFDRGTSWRECGQSTPQKIDKNVPSKGAISKGKEFSITIFQGTC